MHLRMMTARAVSIRSGSADHERRARGAYYTPDAIADEIIANVVADNPEGDFIDPCCGDGSLLVAVAKEIARLRPRMSSKQILGQLHGIDVSQEALEDCMANLSTWASAEEDDFPFANFVCGDALDSDSWPVVPDVIVTNPPWKSVGSVEAARIRKQFPAAARMQGQLELSRVFLIKCCQMIKRGGSVAILCAQSILDGPNSATEREFLLTEGTLERIVSDVQFPGVSLAGAIVEWTKRKPSKRHAVDMDGTVVRITELLNVPDYSLLLRAYLNCTLVEDSGGTLVFLGDIFPDGHSSSGDTRRTSADKKSRGRYPIWENKHIQAFVPLREIEPSYFTNEVPATRDEKRIVLSRMLTSKPIKGTIALPGEYVDSNTTTWFSPVGGEMTIEAMLAVMTSATFRSLVPNAIQGISQYQLMRTPVPAHDPDGALHKSGVLLMRTNGSSKVVKQNEDLVKRAYGFNA